MNIYPFLHFFAFLVYLYLIIVILIKDPKSSLNRVCAALFACFVVWSFGLIFIYNPRASKDTVMLFDNVGSIGWISFASFFLWFALIFTEKKKILKTRIIYPLIFILPFLLIYKQWTGFLIVDYIKQPWGKVWSDSIWAYLFYLYYLSFMAIGLYLILNFGRKTEEPLKKKQAKIIFTTGIIVLILASLTDVLFPNLNIYTIPPLANVIVLIWAFGIAYAIVKYKLMVITPVAAADNIISTMADSLILLDRQGNIASVNKATLDLSGYGKDELEGKSVEIFFREKDFQNTLLDRAIKKEAIRNYELGFKTKTGDNIPVIFSSSTMMDEVGGMAGIVCIVKDITERKRMEDQLIQSEKLSIIGELAAGVAHEIRNPLATISLIIQHLERKCADDYQIEKLKAIQRNISRIDKIVYGLLNFSRPSRSNFAYHNVNEILDRSGLILENLPSDNIKIIKKYETKLPRAWFNPDRLEQVFLNLMSNAMRAMKTGGELYITTSFDSTRKGIIIKFEDTGIGISEGNLKKIFNPFFTTYKEGTGLGLSICQNIINEHKGNISVESKLGKGTIFTIFLPLEKRKEKKQAVNAI